LISAGFYGPCIELSFLVGKSRPAKQRVCGFFSLLDAGLIEGVDAQQLAGRRRLHLEEKEQLSDGEGVDLGQRYGLVQLSGLGQREFGGHLL
jgi:hypothetical protein